MPACGKTANQGRPWPCQASSRPSTRVSVGRTNNLLKRHNLRGSARPRRAPHQRTRNIVLSKRTRGRGTRLCNQGAQKRRIRNRVCRASRTRKWQRHSCRIREKSHTSVCATSTQENLQDNLDAADRIVLLLIVSERNPRVLSELCFRASVRHGLRRHACNRGKLYNYHPRDYLHLPPLRRRRRANLPRRRRARRALAMALWTRGGAAWHSRPPRRAISGVVHAWVGQIVIFLRIAPLR